MSCQTLIRNACDVLVTAGVNAAQLLAIAQGPGAHGVAQVMQVRQTPTGADVWGPRPRSAGQIAWFTGLTLAQAQAIADTLNGVLAQYAATRQKLEALESMLRAEGEGYDDGCDGGQLAECRYGGDKWQPRNEAYVRGWLKAEAQRRAAQAEYALAPFAALLRAEDKSLPDDQVAFERAGKRVTLGDLRAAKQTLDGAHDPARGGRPQ